MSVRRRLANPAAATALLSVLAVAGCQPLPQPFRDDKPSAELIAVPDSAAIAVGTFEGEPRAVAAKLGSAVAAEFLKREIPTSERTTSVGSYRLDGRIEETAPKRGRATVTAFWRLRDPAGHIVVERSDQVEAGAAEWADGSEAPISRLAALGAAGLAGFVTSEAPTPQQAAVAKASGRVRVRVRNGTGAPGDGDTALASAAAAVLRHADLDIVEKPSDKADLDLDAAIAVTPAKDGKQHVKIVWHVARPGGAEIGNVAQENDVPRGRLDAAWGDVAYSIAIAAEGGILELVNRGAPPLRAVSATGVAPVGAAPAGEPSPAAKQASAQPSPPPGAATPAGKPPANPPEPASPVAASNLFLMNPPAVIGPPPPVPFRAVPLAK